MPNSDGIFPANDPKLTNSESESSWTHISHFMQKNPVRVGHSMRHTAGMDTSLLPTTKDAQLTEAEKREVYSTLSAYMHKHPIVLAKAGAFSVFRQFFAMHQFVAGALSVFLLIGAGAAVTSAAESALPDSFLYSIKVGVNEPVIEALTRDPEKKAEVQIKHMLRRIEEAKVMSDKELNEEQSILIEQSIDVFMNRIEEKIVQLESKDSPTAERVADQYRNVLRMQESALNALSEEEVTPVRIEQIMQQVKSARQRFETPEERTERIRKATQQVIIEQSSSYESEKEQIQNRVEVRQQERVNNRNSNSVRIESGNSIQVEVNSRTENSVEVSE